MQHTDLRFLFILLIFFSLPQFSFSFQEKGTSSQDSIMVQKPEPISVNRLVSEIEELRNLISLNSEKIIPGARLNQIDSLYPIYKELIANEETKAREFITSNPNRQKIDNLVRRWDEFQVQLNGWESQITNYVDRNLRLIESFTSETEVWNLTFEQAREQEVPEELLINVREVVDDLNAIQAQTKKYNYNYLRLQTRINRLRQTTVEVKRILFEKKASETYNLFYQRHPPIWQISFGTDTGKPETDTRPETLTDPSARISELLLTHKDTLYFLLMLSIAMGVFILFLRKQLVKSIGLESASDVASESYLLFKLPWAVLAFLVLFVGRLQLLSGTRFLGDILIFFLLLLAILLILHRIPKRYKGLIYLSILFLLLDYTKTYVWFYSSHYRIYMLFEASLMAGSLFYFTKPYLLTRQQLTSPMSAFMIRLVPLAYILCAVSISSNLLGFTNLSDLALKICTQSGIAVIIAYGTLLVFQSILLSWLEQRFHRSSDPNLEHLAFLKKRTGQITRFTVLFLFVVGFLNIIDELRDVTDFINSVMNEPYLVGNLTFTLGSIFMFLLILISSYVVSRLINFLISDQYGVLQFFRLPKGIPAAISLVLRYSILVFGVILALSYLNVDLTQFNLMAGALGLGIGFGLQNVISNFVSGLILVFERPILPGDTIEVNKLFGKVHKIGVRSSNIKTYDGAEVVVPNNNLISNDLINWTLSDSIKRVEILVGTTYAADPNQVVEVLSRCAKKFDYVLKDREPAVHFTGFGESSLNFRLWFWVPFEIGLKAQSDVNIEIYNQFSAHNIEIPYPQRDIHIKNMPAGGKLGKNTLEGGEI